MDAQNSHVTNMDNLTKVSQVLSLKDFGNERILTPLSKNPTKMTIGFMVLCYMSAASTSWLVIPAYILVYINDLISLDRENKRNRVYEEDEEVIEADYEDIEDESYPTQRTLAPSKSAFEYLLDSPFISRAFFGAQRTGKTYLTAVTTQELARTQDITIYHINLASVGEEDGSYWAEAHSVRGDIASLDTCEAASLVDDAYEIVQRFKATKNAILVVDEWAILGSSCSAHSDVLEPLIDLIADYISVLSSSGVKRRQAIWTIAPEMVAGSLTKRARAIKKLSLCYVTIAPGERVGSAGSYVYFDDQLYTCVSNNYNIHTPPKNQEFNDVRITFLNNKWVEVGSLPKLAEPKRGAVVERVVQNHGSSSEPGSQVKRVRSLTKTVEPLSSGTFSGSVHELNGTGSSEPDDKRLLRLIGELNRTGFNQTQIIETIWGVKKGGTSGYTEAREEYRRLTGK